MTTKNEISIHPACSDDAAAIQAIYAHYVLHTTVSLEEVPPTISDIQERMALSLNHGLPYIIAKTGNEIVGYAYAFPYRTRSSYRFTIEESVYISPQCQGKGIGTMLLKEIITHCEKRGYKQMIAVISGNDKQSTASRQPSS